jgi:hypothetical protein
MGSTSALSEKADYPVKRSSSCAVGSLSSTASRHLPVATLLGLPFWFGSGSNFSIRKKGVRFPPLAPIHLAFCFLDVPVCETCDNVMCVYVNMISV